MTTNSLTVRRIQSAQRTFRAGSYGDPAMIPVHIWQSLYGDSFDWSPNTQGAGYTHQWRTCDQRLQRYCMASVQTKAEAIEAQAMGWRTYRVDTEGIGATTGEIICPESRNSKVSCDSCRLCGGTRKQAKNIVIPPIQSENEKHASCYVNTGWLSAMYHNGNLPMVDPETLGKYMSGLMPNTRYTSAIAWVGNSPVDNAPIMLVLTGLSALRGEQSDNGKTGPMVQSYIIRRDMTPIEAVTSGNDQSICGNCPLRPFTVKQLA